MKTPCIKPDVLFTNRGRYNMEIVQRYIVTNITTTLLFMLLGESLVMILKLKEIVIISIYY